MEFPTLLVNMPPPNVLAYPTETIVAEKVEAMVDLGRSNSRMKDFTDLAMAARRVAFDGDVLAAALRATFRRRQTPLPADEVVGLSDEFVQDERALANWRAFAARSQLRGFESLAQVVAELRPFLLPPLDHARIGEPFASDGIRVARGRRTRRRSDSCPGPPERMARVKAAQRRRNGGKP